MDAMDAHWSSPHVLRMQPVATDRKSGSAPLCAQRRLQAGRSFYVVVVRLAGTEVSEPFWARLPLILGTVATSRNPISATLRLFQPSLMSPWTKDESECC